MTADEILSLIFSDPNEVFALYEANGGDYADLKELHFGRKFVAKRFPEVDENDYIPGAEFMFWLSYFMERELTEDIVALEIHDKGSTKEKASAMLEDMYFNDKVRYLVDNSYLKEDDPYFLFLKDVRTLRNHMAHGRLNRLEYGGDSLSHPKGQIKLTIDLHNTLLKKPRIFQMAGRQ